MNTVLNKKKVSSIVLGVKIPTKNTTKITVKKATPKVKSAMPKKKGKKVKCSILTIKPVDPHYKLPPRFKAKWLSALRSGKYEQSFGHLYDNNGKYCCLGVAAKACGISNKSIVKKGNNILNFEFLSLKKIPLSLISNKKLQIQLTRMNDNKKYSFREIATWIDKYL